MTGRRTAASAVALAALLLTACIGGNDGLVEQYQQGGDKGYISGDGTVQEIAPADRGDAVAFTGTAVDGSTVTSTDYAGDVLVLNFWYAGCGPCRAEAPTLESTFQEVEPAGAQFLGVKRHLLAHRERRRAVVDAESEKRHAVDGSRRLRGVANARGREAIIAPAPGRSGTRRRRSASPRRARRSSTCRTPNS